MALIAEELGGMGSNIAWRPSRGYSIAIADRASAVLEALAGDRGGSVDLIASVRLCMLLSFIYLAKSVRFPAFATASRLRIALCYRMHLRTGRSQEIGKPL